MRPAEPDIEIKTRRSGPFCDGTSELALQVGRGARGGEVQVLRDPEVGPVDASQCRTSPEHEIPRILGDPRQEVIEDVVELHVLKWDREIRRPPLELAQIDHGPMAKMSRLTSALMRSSQRLLRGAPFVSRPGTRGA